MANIKSAKKRIEVIERRKTENRLIKSRLATAIKKYRTTLANDVNEAEKLIPDLFSLIDSAKSKGVIHANSADRKKARISLALDKAKASK